MLKSIWINELITGQSQDSGLPAGPCGRRSLPYGWEDGMPCLCCFLWGCEEVLCPLLHPWKELPEVCGLEPKSVCAVSPFRRSTRFPSSSIILCCLPVCSALSWGKAATESNGCIVKQLINSIWSDFFIGSFQGTLRRTVVAAGLVVLLLFLPTDITLPIS